MVVAISKISDKAICQNGGLNAKRAGIIKGEESGNIEDQTAKVLLGAEIAGNRIMIDRMIGIITGIVNFCASPISSPIAEPTAAYKEL